MPVEKYGFLPGRDYPVPKSLHKTVPDGYKVVVDPAGNPKDGTDMRIVKRDNPDVEQGYSPPTIEAREWIGDNAHVQAKRERLQREMKMDMQSDARARKRQDERNR